MQSLRRLDEWRCIKKRCPVTNSYRHKHGPDNIVGAAGHPHIPRDYLRFVCCWKVISSSSSRILPFTLVVTIFCSVDCPNVYLHIDGRCHNICVMPVGSRQGFSINFSINLKKFIFCVVFCGVEREKEGFLTMSELHALLALTLSQKPSLVPFMNMESFNVVKL